MESLAVDVMFDDTKNLDRRLGRLTKLKLDAASAINQVHATDGECATYKHLLPMLSDLERWLSWFEDVIEHHKKDTLIKAFENRELKYYQ